jgi:hypothetical protein
MAAAKTEVDATSLEGVVADWFSHHGMKISNIDIKAVGEDGDWLIGEATRRGSPDYHGLARQAERDLRPKYKLVVFKVTRVESVPIDPAGAT